MSDAINLVSGSSTITINKPGYGYDVDLHFPICSTINADGSRTFFVSSDTPYPVLQPARWMLPTDQAAALSVFLRGPARGTNIAMDFGSGVHSGFFPGGPLYGDMSQAGFPGHYNARIISQAPTGVLQKPLRWLASDLSMIITTTPYPVIGAAIPQGKLSIGIGSTGISDLPSPDSEAKPTPDYKVKTVYSRTGAASSVSGNPAADSFVSTFSLTLRTSNAAAIINAYIGAIAASDKYEDVTFTINDPGYGMFGVDIGVAGTWVCQLLGSEDKPGTEIVLKMKHVGWDRWTIPFTVLYRSAG